jgi:hypothetical protein
MAVDVNNAVRDILPREESRMFGQLDVYPPRVTFGGQNKGERIFIMVRQHILTNLGWVIRTAILIVAPFLVSIAIDYASGIFPQSFPDGVAVLKLLPAMVWIGLGLIYYSSVFTYAFANYIDWYFDIYFVTSERIIHNEFVFLKGKSVSEAPLENIQEVSQSVIGFLPSIFNYGDVIVQTAAEKGKFFFHSVPDPAWFTDVLADLAKIVGRRPL